MSDLAPDREALGARLKAWREELATIEAAIATQPALGLLQRRLDLLHHIEQAEALLAAPAPDGAQRALWMQLLGLASR